jgi:hypothetical protein
MTTLKGNLSTLLIKAKCILQIDELISLFRRVAGHFLRYGIVYVYEHKMIERNEADFVPELKSFAFHIVSTQKEADELIAHGFNFGPYYSHARKRLDKGAIAFCFFVGQELAHVGWVAITQEAKDSFDSLPYHVDFSNRQACTGGTLTIPQYERKGLMTYGYYKRFEFFREKGILTSRNAVHAKNIASRKVHAKFCPRIVARARYVKILCWTYWKECQIGAGVE